MQSAGVRGRFSMCVRFLGQTIPAAGLLLWGTGCAQLALPIARTHCSATLTPGAVRGGTEYATAATAKDEEKSGVVPASAQEVRQLPPPSDVPPPEKASTPPAPARTSAGEPLPISIDTVLRLAGEQNARIAQAREKVREAFADRDIAKYRWLPDVYVGTAFYRHEGGIQNEDGTLTRSSTGAMFSGLELDGRLDIREVGFQIVNARRKVVQEKGELSRITSETLLDAANTYIDLLSARAAQALAKELQAKFAELLDRAKKAAELEKPAEVEVHRIQAEMDAQRQTIAKLRSQAEGASAKLAYLLGLEGGVELVPVDKTLVAFQLVDASAPAAALVNQALQNGPGVRALEGILALIQESMDKAKGPSQFLPIFEVRMAEGGFGAGPGDRLTWDNRWDLALQARWNLTPLVTRKERERLTQAKIQQAHLAYQDLRGKLTMGVREGRETILSGAEQMDLTTSQIKHAQEVYDISLRRLKDFPSQAAGFSESLFALGSLGRAKGSYLSVLNAYDKAQLRLFVLLGSGLAGDCGQ